MAQTKDFPQTKSTLYITNQINVVVRIPDQYIIHKCILRGCGKTNWYYNHV